MPQIKSLPLTIERIEFSSETNILPSQNRYLKLLLYGFNIPFISRYISSKLKKYLKLTSDSSLTPGFKCICGNLFCVSQVALGDTAFIDYAPIYLGNNVKFSFRNMVITSTHEISNFEKVIANSVIIEDNVWITTNVTILPGVRIGKNSVIGAGSVVIKDIPENVLAAGNPCKVIRKI